MNQTSIQSGSQYNEGTNLSCSDDFKPDSSMPTPAHPSETALVDLTENQSAINHSDVENSKMISSGSTVIQHSLDSEQCLQTDFVNIQDPCPSTHLQTEVPNAKQNALAKYRPMLEIPSFQYLHNADIASRADQVPINLQFPGTLDPNSRRLPIKCVFGAPQEQILPLSNDPAWKQMLAYCQRWGTWVAAVADEQRRKELGDWVGKIMQDAWKYAIANGHCGKPNGHTECCSSHDHNRASGRKTLSKGEIRKRPVDVAKQPAPFASEGLKSSYAILNRELEQAGVDMEMVLKRVTPHDLQSGNTLLEEMCERLGRKHLEVADWTTIKYGKFEAKLHVRNLFMFCLWEVQRCHGIVQSSKQALSKATTSTQQKNHQSRLELYQKRADQHLALAVELRENRVEETDEEDLEEQSDAQPNQREQRQKRSRQSTAIIHVTSDEDDVDDEKEESSSMSEDADRSETQSVSDRESSCEQLPSHDNKETELSGTHEESGVDLPIKLGSVVNNDIGAGSAGQHTIATESGDGYLWAEAGHDAIINVEGYENEAHPEETNQHAERNYNSLYSQANHTKASNTGNHEQHQPHSLADAPQTNSYDSFLHTLHEHAQEPDPVSTTENRDDVNADILRRKEEYTARYWQPRINDMLNQNGYGPLKWTLTGWSDIKALLEQLEYSVPARNQLLREFKDGFANWLQTFATPPQLNTRMNMVPKRQIKLHLPNVPAQKSGESSPEELNEYRGFSFRYFNTATLKERQHVDNMIPEYVAAILHDKAPRYGYYVVFIAARDPHQKPLAHGVWNLQKQRKVEDAPWFYQNKPRPANFRANEQILYHDWGYALPPPKKQRKPKTATKRSAPDYSFLDEADLSPEHNDASNFTTSNKRKRHPAQSQPQRRSTTGSRASNKKRRRIADSDESDGEWQPVV